MCLFVCFWVNSEMYYYSLATNSCKCVHMMMYVCMYVYIYNIQAARQAKAMKAKREKARLEHQLRIERARKRREEGGGK